MKDENELSKQIKQHLAHIMAFYGDSPDELMYKLECLVFEWFEKGLKVGRGTEIVCPHCKGELTVYHYGWTAIICQRCEGQINQSDLKIDY